MLSKCSLYFEQCKINSNVDKHSLTGLLASLWTLGLDLQSTAINFSTSMSIINKLVYSYKLNKLLCPAGKM